MPDTIFNSGYTHVHAEGEWTALYDANGDLVSYGDEYVQHEFMEKLFGVKDLRVNSFTTRKTATAGVRKGHEVTTALPSLEQVHAAQSDYEREAEEIQALRDKAVAIAAEAQARERVLKERGR